MCSTEGMTWHFITNNYYSCTKGLDTDVSLVPYDLFLCLIPLSPLVVHFSEN